jgi:SsrA-binding protein
MAKKKSGNQEGPRVIQNRRARFDYHIEDSYEAGVALAGSEVKSIWLGRANISDAFCRVIDGELWLLNMDVEPYEHASQFQHERRRDRKLLMHRKEIDMIARKAQEKGFALLPLKLYFVRGRVKVEVGLGRGKKAYDKRQQIAKDEERRDIERLRSERH